MATRVRPGDARRRGARDLSRFVLGSPRLPFFSLQGEQPRPLLSALKAILESSIGDQPLPTMMPSSRQVMSTQPVKHSAPGKALALTRGSTIAQTVGSSLLRRLVAAARLRLFVQCSACPSFQDALHLHCIGLQRWHQRHPVNGGPATTCHTTWVPGSVSDHSRGPFWKWKCALLQKAGFKVCSAFVAGL